MRIPYFDMLTGDPIPVNGVGHLRSPRLKELSPSGGVGYAVYNVYINVLAWDVDQLAEYCRAMKIGGAEKLKRFKFSFFDAVTSSEETRELCREALAFFMTENLLWDAKSKQYISFDVDEDEKIHAVGAIDEKNFEEVRQMMLCLNYIGLDKGAAPTSYDSSKAKELWERAQAFLKEQSKSDNKEDKPEFHLSNIISKLCAVHPSYNLFNIYDLTVFQLYDAFFQYGYMRCENLSEMIFSNHGGDSFKFENWLKPIFHHI